jgi:hypothetical protein
MIRAAMNKRRNLSSNDWLLISAYLDNQLSDSEKRQMEERLQTDLDCRQELDSLRRTSLLLRSMPVRRVPRNFTLSAQSLSKKLIPSFIGILRFSSAAAALLLVAAFALDLTQQPTLMVASKTAGDLQPAAVAMEAAKAPAAKAPMIIFWGAPAPAMGIYGKGGGGGGAEGSGLGGGGAAPGFYGIGGGGAAQPVPIPDIPPSVEVLPAPEIAPSAKIPLTETPQVQPTETEPQVQAAPAAEPLTGSGPILGVRSPEERGTADVVAEVPLRQPPARLVIPFRLIEIVLAILLAVTALPAWLLKRE